jgi:hypothetical protein
VGAPRPSPLAGAPRPSPTSSSSQPSERVPRSQPRSGAASRTEPCGREFLFYSAAVRPSAPLRWSTVDSLYQSAVTRGRDAIFSRLTKDASSGVLCFLGKASALTGARGRDPLLHASVSRQTRLVEFTRRSISALSECLAETLRASAARPVTHAWIPLVLTAGAARHSNCLLLDVQARTATLFEPHGCDPAHEGHAGTDFLRLYDAPSYYSACSTLLAL